jgi:hypothetical protein
MSAGDGSGGTSALEKLQAQAWALFTGKSDASSAESLLKGTGALSASARAGLYAFMYDARIRDVLRADFPKLRAYLGDEAFGALSSAYIARFPSTEPSITHVGRELSGFLRSQGNVLEAELAALEWARSQVFDAADGTVFPWERVAERASVFPSLVLRFVPGLRVLELSFDVLSLWGRLEEGGPVAASAPAAATGRYLAVVWRKDFTVYHAPIREDEAEALALAREEAPVSEVCTAFARHEEPNRRALEVLGGWFHEGWISDAWVGDGEAR